MNAIVTDHRTLRGMEIAGYIIRNGGPGSRERHWTGLSARVYHVTCGPRFYDAPWYTPFTYKGVEYRLKYFDGCFKPFVVRTGVPTPKFV